MSIWTMVMWTTSAQTAITGHVLLNRLPTPTTSTSTRLTSTRQTTTIATTVAPSAGQYCPCGADLWEKVDRGVTGIHKDTQIADCCSSHAQKTIMPCAAHLKYGAWFIILVSFVIPSPLNFDTVISQAVKDCLWVYAKLFSNFSRRITVLIQRNYFFGV